ncbi:hypothetical protein D0T84_12205 [Dysgonomonas sp. 521]|uniref:sialate O-acetylesterase n=1 Tax=Dysgonomonas sp. 521 TaxID=2302932 RepID=UPI0013D49B07|nr:sialate O-acetylesterase [Dysgonomonas sp. 521]NDV95670.1 hypothetical protein [Dysgonomonas sp. 521]
MNTPRIFYFLFTFLLFISCSDNDEPAPNMTPVSGRIPVILVLGQSNAEGFAPISTAPEWLSANEYTFEQYGMWNKFAKYFQSYQLGANVGSDNNKDTRFGFDIFFAKKYTEKYGNYLYCLKHTLGGTPISEKGSPNIGRWQSHTELIPSGERSMVKLLESKLASLKQFAAKKNVDVNIIAVLYLQGEADADEAVRLDDYEQNFTDLVSYVRTLVGNEHVPFIAAEILYRNTNCVRLNQILHSCSNKDPNLKIVSTYEHLTHLGDYLHYDAAALEYIGNTMFDYYEELK